MNFFFSYHLVSVSPWPLLMSLCVMFFMISVLILFNEYSFFLLMISFILMVMILFQWWRDVVRESTFQGSHSKNVIKGLRLGMFLFILSELMFFLSIFWSFFHMMLAPSIEIGMSFPSFNVEIFNPYNIPLLNTMILLSSGVFITVCHHSLLKNMYFKSVINLMLTLFMGVVFTLIQVKEYNESFFIISDSVYGSIFFFATGFHGLHVLIGSIFIFIVFLRLVKNQFSMYHHFGFEACSWYWHFVDVVWLFLYIFMYWLIFN
nr:cytochrome c oxidase subunit 3 [Meteorus sp. 1 XHS-2023a]